MPFQLQEKLSLTTRRMAVIVFTDIVGYSTISRERDGQSIALILSDQERFVTHAVERLSGRIVKGTGDGYMIEFLTAGDAVEFAVEFQRFLKERQLAKIPQHDFQVRIGIHAGDIVVRDNDLFGDTVNLASRLEGLAAPGGIMVSAAIYNMLSNSRFRFKKAGFRSVKGARSRVRCYSVDLEGASASVSRWQFPHEVMGRIHQLASVPRLCIIVTAMLLGILATIGSSAAFEKFNYLFGSFDVRTDPAWTSLAGGWEAQTTDQAGNVSDWIPFTNSFGVDSVKSVLLRRSVDVKQVPASPALILGRIPHEFVLYLNGVRVADARKSHTYSAIRINPESLKIGENELIAKVSASSSRRIIGQTNLIPIGIGPSDILDRHVEGYAFLFVESRSSLFFPNLILGLILFGMYYVTRLRPAAYLAVFVLSGALLALYTFQFFQALDVDHPYNWVSRNLGLTLPPLALINFLTVSGVTAKWERIVNVLMVAMLSFGGMMFWTADLIPSNKLEPALYVIESLFIAVFCAVQLRAHSFDKFLTGIRRGVWLTVIVVLFYWSVLLCLRSGLAAWAPQYIGATFFSISFWAPFIVGCIMVTVAIVHYRNVKIERDRQQNRDEFLRQVADVVQSQVPAGTKVSRIHKVICDAVKADRSTLFLVSPNNPGVLLRSYVHAGLSKSLNIPDFIELKEGIVGRCWNTRQPILVSDLDSDFRFQHRDRHGSYRTGSCMAIPLISDGHPIGVLTFADPIEKSSFEGEDFQVCLMLSKDLVPFLKILDPRAADALLPSASSI